MKKVILCFMLLTSYLFGHIKIYQGTIGNSKVEFQVEYNFEYKEIKNIIYTYLIYKIPIILEKKDNKTFYEYNDSHQNTGIIQFNDDTFSSGIMKNLKTGESYDIKLLEIEDFGDREPTSDVEIFQKQHTEKFFFRVIIKKESGNHYYIDGINIYNIATGKKLQHINLSSSRKVNEYENGAIVGNKDYYEGNGIFNGFSTIEVGDFDYDGIEDFTLKIKDDVAEMDFGTTYVFDKKKGIFIDVGIMGNYAEFDEKNKTATGTVDFEGEKFVNLYKLEDGKYKLIDEYIMIYDSINEEYIEVRNGEYPQPIEYDYAPELYLYEGNIGDEKINLQFHKGAKTKAIYTYDRDKIPIEIKSKGAENEDTFYEYDSDNKESAEIKFNTNFSSGIEKISGIFKNLKTNELSTINLKLIKKYIDQYDYDGIEVYQSESSKDVFFTVKGHYSSGYEYPSISEVNVYNKKTREKLIFEGVKVYLLNSEPRLMIFDNIKIIGDPNIEGIPDFTVQTSLSDYTKVKDSKNIYSRIFVENKGKTIRYVEYKKEEDGTFKKLREEYKHYQEGKGEY
ncbi:hypothetical protein [Fusobacterium sp. PH5-44]|uniref:hypothetical protein n=1 Tax=unclassified Fusobacterium TaxID=2648384 RepID=UPI003D1E2C93